MIYRINLFTGLAAVICFFIFTSHVFAQEADDLKNLEKIEKKIAEEQDKLKQVTNINQNLSQDVKNLQKNFAEVNNKIRVLENDINKLTKEEKDLEEKIISVQIKISQNQEFEDIVYASALGYASIPPFLLEIVRGEESSLASTLLREVKPQLNKNRNTLKSLLQDLGKDFLQYSEKRTARRKELTSLNSTVKDINDLVKIKENLLSNYKLKSSQISEYLKKLEVQAKNLKDLLNNVALTTEKDWPDLIRNFPDKANKTLSLTIPVGIAQPKKFEEGVVYEIEENAKVFAPFDGLVVFADNFRDSGQVVIIQHRQNFHTLLAGLEKLSVKVGSWTIAGEPIGTMPSKKTNNKITLLQELHKNSSPVNVFSYLAP